MYGERLCLCSSIAFLSALDQSCAAEASWQLFLYGATGSCSSGFLQEIQVGRNFLNLEGLVVKYNCLAIQI